MIVVVWHLSIRNIANELCRIMFWAFLLLFGHSVVIVNSYKSEGSLKNLEHSSMYRFGTAEG